MNPCNDRRKILTFPAVQPYSGASPQSHLNSLTNLCRSILLRYIHRKHHHPYLHRRLFRESLRQVTLLLTFFESLQDETNNSPCQLPPSEILALTELNVTLQRLRYLLADFSRPGATLWLLMHSETVTCELRVLIRTIATSLDIVLSLEGVTADEDVIQIVRMQAAQAWKMNVEIDSEEENIASEVKSMIQQLGNGFSPSRRKLLKFLDKLELKTWEVCNEEVIFLEEELFSGLVEENGSGGCVGFLSCLIGLMTYCRAVVFFGDGPVEGKHRIHTAVDEGPPFARGINPENLRCPISLELMTDPVMVSTGQTYDRKSIERWLTSQRSLSCPVTGEKLATADLVPNLTLRMLVHRFCTENGIPVAESGNRRNRDLSKTESASSRAADRATRITIKFLVAKLDSRSEAEKNREAYEIRLMTKSSLFNRACFVESGAVPLLLTLLCSCDPLTQENSVAALLNLSKHPKGRKEILESCGLKPVLKALTKGYKLDTRQNAAAILFYLSSSDDCRKQIGEMPDAIPAIVDLLRNGTYRGKKNAIVTLFGLLLHSNNHQKVLAADTVLAITGLLSSHKEDLVTDAAAVLGKIADKPEGTEAILKSSAVPLLVEVLCYTGSNSGKEFCVSALLSLCNNGGSKAICVLEEMPSLMPSLYRLVTEGSPQAGKMARSLLNHIHRYYDLDGPTFFRPPVRDRMVHAT